MRHSVSLSKRLFAFLVVVFCLGTALPAQSLRSGIVVRCVVGKDCQEETIDGKQYFVLQSPATVVKVALNPDPKYSRVAMMVENRATFELHLDPSSFRIELTDPKPKRLSYIEPQKLHLPKVKEPKGQSASAPKPALGNSFLSGSSDSTTKPTPKGREFLNESTLSPASSAHGEVYFERSSGAHTGSLVLPIGAVVFEFVYTQTR